MIERLALQFGLFLARKLLDGVLPRKARLPTATRTKLERSESIGALVVRDALRRDD